VVSQNLIDLANARGGEDNVSVIVVSVEAASNTAVTKEEAILTNPHDDDETLVLKDRASLRMRPSTNEAEAKPQKADGVETQPKVDTPQPPSSLPLKDPKMAAERLNDDDGAPTLKLDEDVTEDSRPVSDDEPYSPLPKPLVDSAAQPV